MHRWHHGQLKFVDAWMEGAAWKQKHGQVFACMRCSAHLPPRRADRRKWLLVLQHCTKAASLRSRLPVVVDMH